MVITASTLLYGQGNPIQTDETAPERVHTHFPAPHTACESLLVVAQDRGRVSSPNEPQGKFCLLKSISCFLVRKQVLKQDNQVIGSWEYISRGPTGCLDISSPESHTWVLASRFLVLFYFLPILSSLITHGIWFDKIFTHCRCRSPCQASWQKKSQLGIWHQLCVTVFHTPRPLAILHDHIQHI